MGDSMIYEAITAYNRYFMFQKYSKQYVINILDVLFLTFLQRGPPATLCLLAVSKVGQDGGGTVFPCIVE